MKKRTWATLIFAVILIIVSGITSILSYQKLESEREKNTVKKTFKYDQSEELVINIKNSATLNLSTSSDNNVHLTKDAFSYNSKEKDNTDWSVKKEGKQTVITVDNKNRKQTFHFALINFGDLYDDSIYLSLPESYKKITVTGSNLDVNANNLNLKNLDIKTKSGNVYGYDLITDELSIENTHGNTQLSEARINNELTINSSNGYVNIEETAFSDLTASLKNGEISTSTTKGNMNITNENGDIYVNQSKGVANLKGQNGNIEYKASQINSNVTVETAHGDIQMALDESIFKKQKIDFTTKLGNISIFNENLDSQTKYTQDTGFKTVKATSKSGDITVYQLDDDDNEYWDE